MYTAYTVSGNPPHATLDSPCTGNPIDDFLLRRCWCTSAVLRPGISPSRAEHPPILWRLHACVRIFRTIVRIFLTNLDGPVGGCCGGRDEPARPVQSASHYGTDPPYLTFEARFADFSPRSVLSGRLLRLTEEEGLEA